MNPELSRVEAGRLFGEALYSGRKFVELIKVVFQSLVWRLERMSEKLVKLRQIIPLHVLAQLIVWNLIIFLPDSVNARPLLNAKEMPNPMNCNFNGWLGATVKSFNPSIWKCGDLFTDKHPKSVLCILGTLPTPNVNHDTSTNDSGDDWDVFSVISHLYEWIVSTCVF